MDCASTEYITVCGNFAELQQSKPEPFDYDKTARWIEPYSMDWREVLGDAICNCATVEVNYAPYYGWDYFHRPNCNLMRKLASQPQIANLQEVYLPAMNHFDDSVPNTGKRTIWVDNKTKRSRAVKVRHILSGIHKLQLGLGVTS